MDLIKQIDEHLNSKEDYNKERNYFRVSEIAKSKKELFNALKGNKKEKYEARTKRIFDNGNSVHSRFYKYFAEMQILVAAEIDAVKNDLIHGRLDAIITDRTKNYVVDIKSMSQWVFQKLRDEPPFDAKLQVLFYMYYTNIPQGFVLIECKNTQTIKTFYLEMTDENKKLVEKTIEELKLLKTQIEANIEPEEEVIKLEDISYIG